MQRLHKLHFELLQAHRGYPALSLYLPTEQADAEMQAADLETLLLTAERSLKERGVLRVAREALLDPARKLLEDIPFWTSWSIHNLTFFGTEDGHHFLRSPYSIEPRVSLGERFFLLPLLPILHEDFHFYVLEVQPERRQLYTGDLYHLRALSPQELPASLREALLCPEGELGPALSQFAAGLTVVVAGGEGLAIPGVRRLDTALPPAGVSLPEHAWARLRADYAERLQGVLARCADGLTPQVIRREAARGALETLVVGDLDEWVNEAALEVLEAGGEVLLGPPGSARAVLRASVPARR